MNSTIKNIINILKNKKLLIGIGIIGIIIILIIVILKKQNVISLETFESDNQQISATTAQYSDKGESLDMNEPAPVCNAKDQGDVVGYCSQSDICCDNKDNPYTKCACSHPLVAKCKSEYENCLKDEDILKFYNVSQRLKKCKEQMKGCCIPYGSVKGDLSKFGKPEKRVQKRRADILCEINNYDSSKIREKCTELCQTNPDCVAFSIDDSVTSSGVKNSECKLFTKVNQEPIIITAYGKPDVKSVTDTDYYIKN